MVKNTELKNGLTATVTLTKGLSAAADLANIPSESVKDGVTGSLDLANIPKPTPKPAPVKKK